MAKYKILLNSANNIQELLQIAYEEFDSQIIQAQNEINKLANSTKLQEEIIEGKTKYAKSINDYLKIKNDAISKKIDIARLLTEIYKHNGDVERTLSDDKSMKNVSLDFSKIRQLVNEEENKKTEFIQLKKN
ncbi:MAG: hypothetical protein IKT40_02670 [Bacilli bacterium]|nr:hypothetical protein [Bacilli bacterium]